MGIDAAVTQYRFRRKARLLKFVDVTGVHLEAA